MKAKLGLAFLCTAFLLLLTGGNAEAFHSGGVAECSGCHSMHEATSPSFLLVGSDASSTCLSCHQHAGDTAPNGYHISTADTDMPDGVPPIQRSPGGDFGWLKKTYTWVPRTGADPETSEGEVHGHNIVAADQSYVADITNTTSPGGGSFPASQLGCQSCHDPHGRARRLADGTYVNAVYNPGSTNAPIMSSGSYGAVPTAGLAVGVYRLLRGLGDNSQGAATFTGVPIAVAPSRYNQSEAVNQVRVAYGSSGANTWGTWCGTCHPNMHSGAGTTHPVDHALGSTIANAYNAYVKSGDLTGVAASSYSSLVPFAEPSADIAVLASHAKNDNSFLSGPGSSDQVTCLSCHRAHASGFDFMLRWNMGNEFIVRDGSYTANTATGQGRTEEEMTAAYYDRPASQFATYQRVLCNKCHAKD